MGYHMGAPGAEFSPAVQDAYREVVIWSLASHIFIEQTEFITDFLDILDKIRELKRQL